VADSGRTRKVSHVTTRPDPTLLCCLLIGAAAHSSSDSVQAAQTPPFESKRPASNARDTENTKGTEAQLVKSLQAIKNNRLDLALNEVDSLLLANPNFKLAQLVKGDLLMARAGAIDSFGSASNAPSEK